MRALPLLLALGFATSLLVPPAAASTCVTDPNGTVCVGYTVISSDCRVGAIAVNGLFLDLPGVGGFLAGEVFWEVCANGLTVSGHAIEAFGVGWYDMTVNGERSCWIYAGVDAPTDCAQGPPYLPMLP